MDDAEAWAQEKRLWLEGGTAYGDLLDPACVMAFPGMPLMRAASILKSVDDAPRWKSVEMKDREIGRPSDAMLVLGYAAVGQREGTDPYHCTCTSTYRRDGKGWKLIQHQQTPIT